MSQIRVTSWVKKKAKKDYKVNQNKCNVKKKVIQFVFTANIGFQNCKQRTKSNNINKTYKFSFKIENKEAKYDKISFKIELHVRKIATLSLVLYIHESCQSNWVKTENPGFS